MLFSWLPFFLFAIGLCVGSFVNVLVFRTGFDERPEKRSHCMACDSNLAWYDLIPVLSYAMLSARCRACGSALSVQYPLVELGVGLLFLSAAVIVPPALSLWSIAAFVSLLVFLATFTALVAYDIRHTLVPFPFIYALLASAALAALFQSLSVSSFYPVYDSIAGGAVLAGFFALIIFATRGKGMGEGDAYIAAAMGLLFGFFRGIEAVMIGVWTGAIVGLLMLFFRKRVTMKTELPLVPFLAFGTLIALFTSFSPLALVANLSGFLFPHP